MRGDVEGMRATARRERRVIRAMARIEKSQKKRRKHQPQTEQLSVRAITARRFSTTDLPTCNALLMKRVVERLMTARVTGANSESAPRRAFLISEVCERGGLLVAPRCLLGTVQVLVQTISAITASNNMCPNPLWETASPALTGTPLLQSATDGANVDAPLFGRSFATDEACATIFVSRINVAGVALFMLHGAGASADSVSVSPDTLGLTAVAFGRMQVAAARLLGIRLAE